MPKRVRSLRLRREFYLVSELAVGNHALDVEIDVTSLERVCQQSESERIGTALKKRETQSTKINAKEGDVRIEMEYRRLQ